MIRARAKGISCGQGHLILDEWLDCVMKSTDAFDSTGQEWVLSISKSEGTEVAIARGIMLLSIRCHLYYNKLSTIL